MALRERARRARRRLLGVRSPPPGASAPAAPIGAKLELTYRCNLRCAFCYTDSPRRTLQRTLDLPDHDWRRIAEELIEVGVLEVVLTGGEPLLRRGLALDLLERFDQAGVCTLLNTNGWFVDDAVADRMAGVRGARIHVSIDGSTPELHDASRGVPGSWRRAIGAIGRLLDRGVAVHVVHVVTPANEAYLGDFLEQMWVLGVPSVRLTQVADLGAAARSPGRWRVRTRAVRREVARFRSRHGDAMYVRVVTGEDEVLSSRDGAPGALLVRPAGGVAVDSLHPFVFADARGTAIGDCWQALLRGWADPEVTRWSERARSPREISGAGVTPYRDDDVAIGSLAPAAPAAARPEAEPAPPAATFGIHDAGAQAAADEHVLDVALGRRYDLAPVRVSAAHRGAHYVHVLGTGRVCRLNATAVAIMRACDGATAGGAVQALAGLAEAPDRASLARDVLATTRWLGRRGMLTPAAPVDGPALSLLGARGA